MNRTLPVLSALALIPGIMPGMLRADVIDTLWLRRYGQPGYCNDEATAMVVDGAGNVYVAGSSQRTEAGLKDFATVKNNSAGVRQWHDRLNGPGSGTDCAQAICLDSFGNVAVCGYVAGSGVDQGLPYDEFNQAPGAPA